MPRMSRSVWLSGLFCIDGCAGKAGLWTKADSVTWFDDFVVESFDAAR
jgi:hypothetical protein